MSAYSRAHTKSHNRISTFLVGIATSGFFPYSLAACNFGAVYLNLLMISMVVHMLFERPIGKVTSDLSVWFDRLLMPPPRSASDATK